MQWCDGMRGWWWCFAVVVGIGEATGIQAQDPPSAEQIVTSAIEAMAASPEKLDKLKLHIQKKIGTFEPGGGVEAKTTLEITAQWPNLARFAFQLAFPDNETGQITLLLKGDTAYRIAGEEAVELNPDEFEELRTELYINWLITLLPLRDRLVTLRPEKGIEINGITTHSVRAVARGRPDVILHFDPKTHHLLRLRLNMQLAGTEVRREVILGDYQAIDGLKLPTTRTDWTNGRKVGDWKSIRYVFPEKVATALFAKPGKLTPKPQP